jgi:hypothetical protein
LFLAYFPDGFGPRGGVDPRYYAGVVAARHVAGSRLPIINGWAAKRHAAGVT